MAETGSFPCPCCGCLTLPEPPPNTFFICPVCFWEDDGVQLDDPSYTGGANRVSLAGARANFRAFGAIDEASRALVRAPSPDEIPSQAAANRGA